MVTLDEVKDTIERNTYNTDLIEVSIDESGYENEECVEIYLYSIDTLQMSEDNYHEFEKLCDSFEREINSKFDTLTAYATYDISGYDYWTNREEESNYCIVVLCITEDTQIEDIVRFSEALDDLYDSIINLYDIE